ncbi:MAG: hypothetical protein COV52_06920 [Gammaproteobacteria bacterium CG11_big_fil_rev_8_21_14_0_20_46_22]|nr:MAG: hypothetical protein COW05_06325 [Gammaproteobacteria bacterium CG12_big_fil_rev_8_21_14_0_65_46_12]PIR10772.1 MAG: hypothetical protein COV52_06920 [Gammaproteobacteria bacterium CG11_big_fil_rev_8_21_14_0_20_46_22]
MSRLSNKCLFKLSTALVLLVLSIVAQAKTYRINLLVFTHVTPDTLASEQWRSYLYSPASLQKFAVLQSSENQPPVSATYTLLPGPKQQLRGIGRLLARQKNHIVLDVAWLQSNDAPAKWLHIYGGQAYDAKGQVISQDSAVIHDFPVLPQAAYWQIDGAVKVDLGRFIMGDVKLNLTLPVSQVSGVSDSDFGQQFNLVPLQSFSINQTQRMLLSHFTYFDHPLFGVLVSIQAVKPNE